MPWDQLALLISAGALMKDADKVKLMLLAWNYNLQQQAQAQAQAQAQVQAQAANAALSPNNSSTTTATTVGTPVTSQSAISTANNTINNSTLTGNALFPSNDQPIARNHRTSGHWFPYYFYFIFSLCYFALFLLFKHCQAGCFWNDLEREGICFYYWSPCWLKGAM